MNVVKDAPVKLGLGEAPSSPAFQMQQSQLVGSMITALAGTPQAALLVPTWVEQNSAFGPGRKQLAEDMRKMAGLPSAADKAGADQWQKQQQEQAAQQAQMEAQVSQAALAKEQAQAGEAKARIDKLNSETLKNLTEVSAVTAANEDQLISEALQEALAS